ncbi:winged helix-turn-helix domain-containing protein [Paenibacillus sp. N4]|uniref:winged helix-turn-helix transcriptional regulator n=1 Tax=Paenibacillus vietnamensis TaxID=2590547 RepID=UPI001CD143DC|nr:winged helix-turn-helix domain-containing protein [Paenibacillus vietnamensis]MCA0754854.1 winged helix-turn-helix domain-containing protein [Paenibacillus vietnamensis]
MIYISTAQAYLLELIKEKPDMRYKPISEITGWPLRTITERFQVLVDKGIIRREGNKRFFNQYITDVPYTVTQDGYPPGADPQADGTDVLLKDLATFTPTDEQRLFIHGHKHLPRKELARRLGIGKLEVNLALLQMGLGKK